MQIDELSVCVDRCTQACVCDRVVRLGEEDVGRTVITVDKQDETTSAVLSQTMHLTDFKYCLNYCLCISIKKVILLHFNLFFHFTFCDRGGTSARSPVMPSCLLDLSLFCTRLSSGFRGEQISFKAANAPISVITACPLLLLLMLQK